MTCAFGLSPFFIPVGDVIGVRAEEKMIGIYATFCIATMANV
jgi:hypothetical protein